jgi:type III secretory pathway component EscT
MNTLPIEVLAPLVAFALRAGLVSARLVPLTLMLPFFGGRVLPAQARVPVLLALAIGAAPAVLWDSPVPTLGPWLAVGLVRELALGVLLALVLGAPLFALEQGGRLLDAARGANASEVIASEGGERTSPLSELLRWTFGVVFLAAGGLRAIVRVLASSYAALPPAASVRPSPLPTARWVELAARWSAEALAVGVTLVAPGLLALVAVELTLAVAARLSAPIAQSNAVMPLRALVPLAALALTTSVWTGAAQEFAERALAAAAGVAR